MKVPFLDLKRQYNSIKSDIEAAIKDVCESCVYIEGPVVNRFEQSVSEYLGVKHVITCGSGTAGLEIAMRAAGIKPGDEVITTAFSFFATAEAISAIGAIPVFADVNEHDYNIDAESVRALITDKTKAILPVHIFGHPVDCDAISGIAKEYGLKVIEDACQAIGSEYKGRKIGTFGDAAAFSFYPTKNLGAFGDGGMITTNDDSIATIARAIKAHAGGKIGYQASKLLGMDTGTFEESDEQTTDLYDPYKYYNYLIGDNSRLDSIQAAILNIKLSHLDEYNNKRSRIAEKYNEAFADLPIQLPPQPNETEKPCWHQYVFLTEEKDAMVEYLGKNGVGVGTFYPVPLHLQIAFNDLKYQEGSLPVAEKICKQSVCLPIFPELRDEEIDYVIKVVKAYF